MFNNLISKIDGTTWIFIALLGVMVIVLVVLPMFTNKKRNKAINELHSSLKPGDVIKTVGGLIGTITAIRDISPVDKEMVIETGEGSNKCSMVFDVQAVYQVISKSGEPAVETPFEEINSAELPAEPVVDEISEVAPETALIAESATESETASVIAPSEEATAAKTPAAKKPSTKTAAKK